MATHNEPKHKADAYRSEGWKPFNWEKGGPNKVRMNKQAQCNDQMDESIAGEEDAPMVPKLKDVTNRDMTCKLKYY